MKTAKVKATCTINVTKVAVKSIKLYYDDEPVKTMNLLYEEWEGDGSWFDEVVYPEDATYTDVFWTSSNPDVVSVDYEGEFEVNGIGKAVITCWSIDNLKVKASVTINVLKTPVEELYVYYGGSEIDEPIELYVDDYDDGLEAEVWPEEASIQDVKWTSSNSKVVYIDPETGEMEALKKGTVTITCTSKDNSRIKKSFKVKVYDYDDD